MPQFVLKINLGNEMMSTPEDVATALRNVANRIDGSDFVSLGKIVDINGNTVGSWSVI